MRYEKPEAGEWVQPRPRGYKLACCDCGLVHRLNFRVVKWAAGSRTKVQFQVFRDNRATAAMRRKRPATRSVTKSQAVDGPKAAMPNRKGCHLSVSRDRPNRNAVNGGESHGDV